MWDCGGLFCLSWQPLTAWIPAEFYHSSHLTSFRLTWVPSVKEQFIVFSEFFEVNIGMHRGSPLNPLLEICHPSGCTVVSGVVVGGGGVCNRSQMRTSFRTCFIFGVSIGLDPGCKCTKGIFDRSEFKVTHNISPTISGWLLVKFVIVMEAISREFRVALLWVLLYADDMVVIAETEDDLIKRLKEW